MTDGVAARVLIVDDDVHLRDLMVNSLALDGYEVTATSSGEAALALILDERFDLIVLDARLPGISGIETLCRVRTSSDVPAIIVSVDGDVVSRVAGLSVGADDYLAKPFSRLELLSRIKAVLRRVPPVSEPPGTLLGPGGLRMDAPDRHVHVQGTLVKLTDQEFDVLRLLLQHTGEVVSYETIARIAWSHGAGANANAVHACVSRLRMKLITHGTGDCISTVRGIGYKVAEPLAQSA